MPAPETTYPTYTPVVVLPRDGLPTLRYDAAYLNFRSVPCVICLPPRSYVVAELTQDRDWDYPCTVVPDQINQPEWRWSEESCDLHDPLWWMALPEVPPPSLSREAVAVSTIIDARRCTFIRERFNRLKTSAWQRVIDDLRLVPGQDPFDSSLDAVVDATIASKGITKRASQPA